jgi:acyl dehydratase
VGAESFIVGGHSDLPEFWFYLFEDVAQLFMAVYDPHPDHVDAIQVGEGA